MAAQISLAFKNSLTVIQHKKKEEIAWKNGNYNSKGEFVFNDLEADVRYEFQVCSLGPDSLMSDWTMPVGIMVS